VSNAKKYFEALTIPDLQPTTPKKGTPNKKQKIRQRRGSDALPPWPNMNADIVCLHDGLALAKVVKAKRRPIDWRCWRFLRQYYPEGPEFRCSTTTECCLCQESTFEAKVVANEKKISELLIRKNDLVTPLLESLFNRKSGVPGLSLMYKYVGGAEDFVDDSVDSEYISKMMEFPFQQPLVPGMYNVVQRNWLRDWRRYVKDPKLNTLHPLDCSSLFCAAHGHLVVPPHLEEYLIGMKKSLLVGLGGYSGMEIEILSLEEWEEIQKVVSNSYNDLYVRFFLDGESVIWNCPVCMICDPYTYSPLRMTNKKGKKNNLDDFFVNK
jgi:hypothetical protein